MFVPFRRARHARVLIIVQNLPVPLDRRVWLECQALVAAGYGVSVICPKGPGDPSRHVVDGVRIYKYTAPPAVRGVLGYLFEFVYCWLRTALLSVEVLVRDGFAVIQACNPPDTYWLLARFYKLLGKKFVYDQHDLNPEVFRSRFGEPKTRFARAQFAFLRWLELRTYRTADHVISTNESYRRVAIERGQMPPESVTVVRSGPSTSQMRPIESEPDLRCGRKHMLVYLGIMGPQDGVDLVLRVLDVLVHRWGREDVHAALLGFGDSHDGLLSLSRELGLDNHVTFTGRADPAKISRYLSSAHVGISPDPLNPLNDVSTMNKTMEYMSFALPVVAFDLTETRVSGGDAIAYLPASAEITEQVVENFARVVAELLDDPQRRAEMALSGRRRAESILDWAPQRDAYLRVYDAVTGHVSRTIEAEPVRPVDGGQYLDVSDDGAVLAFGSTRRLPTTVEAVVASTSRVLTIADLERLPVNSES